MAAPTEQNNFCGICFDPYDSNRPMVSHKGQEKHGFHKECILPWLNSKQFCPTCRAPFNGDSLLSLKDRALSELKPAAIKIGIGLVSFAVMMAVTLSTAYVGGLLSGKGIDAVLGSDAACFEHVFF